MSAAEIKLQLIRLIDNTEDASLLNKAYATLSKLLGKKEDWWDEISDEEKAVINKGREQLRNGEGIPHAEVRKEINKILGK